MPKSRLRLFSSEYQPRTQPSIRGAALKIRKRIPPRWVRAEQAPRTLYSSIPRATQVINRTSYLLAETRQADTLPPARAATDVFVQLPSLPHLCTLNRVLWHHPAFFFASSLSAYLRHPARPRHPPVPLYRLVQGQSPGVPHQLPASLPPTSKGEPAGEEASDNKQAKAPIRRSTRTSTKASSTSKDSDTLAVCSTLPQSAPLGKDTPLSIDNRGRFSPSVLVALQIIAQELCLHSLVGAPLYKTLSESPSLFAADQQFALSHALLTEDPAPPTSGTPAPPITPLLPALSKAPSSDTSGVEFDTDGESGSERVEEQLGASGSDSEGGLNECPSPTQHVGAELLSGILREGSAESGSLSSSCDDYVCSESGSLELE
eukprot:CAMPEP_0177637852 /NCGR_PEP_ID=MMETSP0447-20121125/5185_1 /TAXON_ID=0 /ORGANISM="Stygamoeba regulata, Strain BSH-02190019" /LENGTH=374 /DNA_ID=CAMNT_0019139793 /DNA_START=204 /DNA_END=1328 /DNA_ORIENTATION=+